MCEFLFEFIHWKSANISATLFVYCKTDKVFSLFSLGTFAERPCFKIKGEKAQMKKP